MLTKIVMEDKQTDGAFPVSCDMTLDGLNVIIDFPDLEIELIIPIDVIGTLLNDDLHG